MNPSAIFVFGLLVTIIATAGLVLTVVEFKRIQRNNEPRNPKFPL